MATINIDRDRSEPFEFKVPMGEVRGWASVNKFGQNTDVDAAAVEDVWDAGGSWTSPSGSSLVQLFASSANDSVAGTGAQTVTVQGLDSDGLLQDNTVSLAGATRVTTDDSFSMIHRMFVATAGSGGTNSSTISALNPNDTTLTLAQILTGNAQTLMAIYRVPNGKTALMDNYYGTVVKPGSAAVNPNVSFSLFVQSSVGGVFQLKHRKGTADETSHTFNPPFTVAANQTIRIEADTDSNDTNVTAGFDLYLKDN